MLDILRKETGLGQIEAEALLEKADGDVVTAILLHQGEDPFPHRKKPQVLTETQQKIKELRTIVDQKDAMMDSILAAKKAK